MIKKYIKELNEFTKIKTILFFNQPTNYKSKYFKVVSNFYRQLQQT